MAYNFTIKKDTYNQIIETLRAQLNMNNIDGALMLLDKAIILADELSRNATIVEIKKKYQDEKGSLINLRNKLSKNVNPFTSNNSSSNSTYKKEETSSEDKKVNSKYFSSETPNVKLEDIAGLEDVKEQIKLNVIIPLKDPDLYFKYCDTLGTKILMYGPPGCGKSFIAEAIAGELECKYCVINAADILDKYVGEAPKKIKEIFEEANQYDNCLIFFDELDSLFASRESDDSSHTKDILTTFLTCLSGFGVSKQDHHVKVIIGATNRPWALDSALLRGKRFDNQIYVGLPDYEAREFMIKKTLKKHLDLLENTDITLMDIANRLDGFSGADITAIVGKLQQMVLKKALDHRGEENSWNEKITLDDFNQIISKYRNSISKESIDAYLAFKNGEI